MLMVLNWKSWLFYYFKIYLNTLLNILYLKGFKWSLSQNQQVRNVIDSTRHWLSISNIFSKNTLQKKWSFQLRISSVNVTKSAGNYGFGHINWRNPQWKTFFCAVTLKWKYVSARTNSSIWLSSFSWTKRLITTSYLRLFKLKSTCDFGS